MKLKRLLLIAPLVLSLVGCAKHDQPKKMEASSSSKTSIYVVKDKHKKKKSEKKSKSDKKTDESKESEKDSSNQEKTGVSGNSSELPPSDGTLTDFVNRYGMSPALWLQKHGGLTQQQALEQLPRGMKSSGEIQTENAYHGIGVGSSPSTNSNEAVDKYRVRPSENQTQRDPWARNNYSAPPTTNNNAAVSAPSQNYQSTPSQSSSQTDSVPVEVVPAE